MKTRSDSLASAPPRGSEVRRLPSLAWFALVVGFVGCGIPSKPDEPWPQRAQRFLEQVDNWHAGGMSAAGFRDAIHALHRERFGMLGHPQQASAAELEARFEAAWETAFYVVNTGPENRDWLLDELSELLDALESRGLATAEHVRGAHQIAVQARRFDLASRLELEWPGVSLSPLPELEMALAPAGTPMAWWPSPGTGKLRLRPATLPSPGVVVVMHPGCGPAARAAADILANPRLAEILAERGRWFVSPSIELGLAAQARWEKAFPRFPLAHIHRSEAFSFLDEPGVSPVFYVLDGEGRAVAKLVGWPPEGRMEALTALLAHVGIGE
jgi:hypothetical protein